MLFTTLFIIPFRVMIKVKNKYRGRASEIELLVSSFPKGSWLFSLVTSIVGGLF